MKVRALQTVNLRIGTTVYEIKEGEEYGFSEDELKTVPKGYLTVISEEKPTRKSRRKKDKEGEEE